MGLSQSRSSSIYAPQTFVGKSQLQELQLFGRGALLPLSSGIALPGAWQNRTFGEQPHMASEFQNGFPSLDCCSLRLGSSGDLNAGEN